MNEKMNVYSALVMGNKCRWIFPVEAELASIKAMQDDGIYIFRLESEFVHTDTMRLYDIHVQGDTNKWVLSSPLEPEIAQVIRDGGLMVFEKVELKGKVSE